MISTYGLLSDLGLDQLQHPQNRVILTLKDNSHFTQHNHDTCTTDSQSKNNNTFAFEEAHTEGMHP